MVLNVNFCVFNIKANKAQFIYLYVQPPPSSPSKTKQKKNQIPSVYVFVCVNADACLFHSTCVEDRTTQVSVLMFYLVWRQGSVFCWYSIQPYWSKFPGILLPPPPISPWDHCTPTFGFSWTLRIQIQTPCLRSRWFTHWTISSMATPMA